MYSSVYSVYLFVIGQVFPFSYLRTHLLKRSSSSMCTIISVAKVAKIDLQLFNPEPFIVHSTRLYPDHVLFVYFYLWQPLALLPSTLPTIMVYSGFYLILCGKSMPSILFYFIRQHSFYIELYHNVFIYPFFFSVLELSHLKFFPVPELSHLPIFLF